MTKLQILANQIESDIVEVDRCIETGLYKENPEGLLEEYKAIHKKIKEWGEEANKIIEEAKAIDSKVEEVEEEDLDPEE